MLPLASTSVRLFAIEPQNGTCVPVSRKLPGSWVSVVEPCARPKRANPPFFGSAPMPSLASSEVASAVVTPSAAARPMNSRLAMRPFLICCVQYSSSVICVSLNLRLISRMRLFSRAARGDAPTAGLLRRAASVHRHV